SKATPKSPLPVLWERVRVSVISGFSTRQSPHPCPLPAYREREKRKCGRARRPPGAQQNRIKSPFMAEPLGLIAGEGIFPLLVARGARAAGRTVICAAFRGS